MLDIYFEDGKYHVTSNIDFEISTNDIDKVHEMLQVEYEYQFAEAIRKVFVEHTLIMQVKNNQQNMK